MNTISDDLMGYYCRGKEQNRLCSNHNVERERTQELLTRYLPPAPAIVLDVGGGAGIYALWLARHNYTVHLIDPVPLHVEQAQAASSDQRDNPLASAAIGDARDLKWPVGYADAVLMLGPIYHLPESSDRIRAMQEGYRVLKPQGVMFVAAISRFASAMDGIRRGFLADSLFASLVEEDIRSGQHSNPTGQEHYFTSAYFHRPDELQAEMQEAGFVSCRVIAIEGIGWIPPSEAAEQRWKDDQFRKVVYHVIRLTETEPAVLGASEHLMAIGLKP